MPEYISTKMFLVVFYLKQNDLSILLCLEKQPKAGHALQTEMPSRGPGEDE